LTHIVRNYDALSDYTMFLQGDPFDHLVAIEDIGHHLCATSHLDFSPMQPMMATCDVHGKPDHDGLELAELMKNLIGRDVEAESTTPMTITFTPGAQFIASRECLRMHPQEFWRDLLDLSEARETFPWELERLWFYILGAHPAHTHTPTQTQ
jgi:hypothetical protein